MVWQKLGEIWLASDHLFWASMVTLTPTRYLLGNGLIRVFCDIRDKEGIGRIDYFDILESNPTQVINFSQSPVQDVDIPGVFDDNGILLGDIVKVRDLLRMYYAGFQPSTKAKILAYGGLAISKDNY
jgi:hypothetical protein